jgi:hypothetical protein
MVSSIASSRYASGGPTRSEHEVHSYSSQGWRGGACASRYALALLVGPATARPRRTVPAQGIGPALGTRLNGARSCRVYQTRVGPRAIRLCRPAATFIERASTGMAGPGRRSTSQTLPLQQAKTLGTPRLFSIGPALSSCSHLRRGNGGIHHRRLVRRRVCDFAQAVHDRVSSLGCYDDCYSVDRLY